MGESKIVIYKTQDGQTQVDVRFEDETVWLSVNQMSLLFDRETSNVRRHILNVFREGELPKESNVHFLHVPFSDKPVPFYSLDVIISVGYRVKSQQGTQFRIWANRILKDYLVKGYAINERRIKQVEAKYSELKEVVRLIGRTVALQENVSPKEKQFFQKRNWADNSLSKRKIVENSNEGVRGIGL